MFGKPNDKNIEKFNKIETIVSHHTEIKGNMSSKGSLRIDGIFEGIIEHADGIILGETGIIKGDINAQNIVIGGKITGNITAAETIEILETAQVYGDMNSSTLSIAEGAIFEGNCIMTKSTSTQPRDENSGAGIEDLEENRIHSKDNQYTGEGAHQNHR